MYRCHADSHGDSRQCASVRVPPLQQGVQATRAAQEP